MKAQRVRIRYAISSDSAMLGQRDIVEAWERACADAQVPLAYSEGKRPSPQISIAAPLSQGVTSNCELLDLYLSEVCPPDDILQRLAARLPAGITPVSAEEIGVSGPSLQSQLRRAEYRIEVEGADLAAIEASVGRLLTARTFPAEYKREARIREYDLRPLVLSICVTETDTGVMLAVRLRAEAERTARADQVAIALGLPENSRIERTALELEEVSPVVLSYRRAGEPNE
jgi:radical SAM-linked protein